MMEELEELYRMITGELIRHGLTACTMESCTAGLIVSLLTDTEGSSAVIPGGIVTYGNAAKERFGVPGDCIADFGVYSGETAEAMARAAAENFGTDISLGVTGTFGNTDPANADSVPGEVWFSLFFRGRCDTEKIILPFSEDRLRYKMKTARVIGERLLALLADAGTFTDAERK